MLYTPSQTTTSSFTISCTCGQSYGLILIGDIEYWRSNIIPSDGVLEETKRLLHDDTITFDTIIRSMLGIAKFGNGTIHVCFMICNVRGYFDCIEEHPIITLLTVWKTRRTP
ncbi:MAG: hypothetical protein HW410_1052 [Nitrosarchaeum sp.]|nr:hypothetical protein [Nitrosarchaeum sp.]